MKDKLTCILSFGVILVFSLLCFFLPKDDFSESERRVLASFPEANKETIFSGKFSSDFEEYATDVFPFRDNFRTIKAYTATNIFGKSDNNKLFMQNGHLSKIEYPMQTKLLDHATERFGYIHKTYLEGKTDNIYLSIIPDKNYHLDTLKFDYGALTNHVRGNMPYAEYVDIFPLLSLSDYYTTDSHWKQECIGDVAEKLLSAMGKKQNGKFEKITLDVPFYGVYSGQAALPTPPDTITYLTNDTLRDCIVINCDTGMPEEGFMYDMKKAEGHDPYEMFLSGNSALLMIENPSNRNGKHLVVFRDSFASSLLPLMIGEYEKVTVFDIRYVQSEMIGAFVRDFTDTDVLFLYSASMLNSSGAMK